MNKWIILLDYRASEDIDSAVRWYSEKQMELALEFLNAVDAVFESISQLPQSYQEVVPGIRKAMTRKFPFCVYYTVDNNRLIVFAILHASRNSETWQQRLD